jgi:hypothetical protein
MPLSCQHRLYHSKCLVSSNNILESKNLAQCFSFKRAHVWLRRLCESSWWSWNSSSVWLWPLKRSFAICSINSFPLNARLQVLKVFSHIFNSSSSHSLLFRSFCTLKTCNLCISLLNSSKILVSQLLSHHFLHQSIIIPENSKFTLRNV